MAEPEKIRLTIPELLERIPVWLEETRHSSARMVIRVRAGAIHSALVYWQLPSADELAHPPQFARTRAWEREVASWQTQIARTLARFHYGTVVIEAVHGRIRQVHAELQMILLGKAPTEAVDPASIP